MQKIHIVGAVGSGKTTLAKKLSTSLGIPMYEMDSIVWERKPGGYTRRMPEKRDEQLDEIVQFEKWIIEGAQHRWVNNSFLHANLIILLDTPYHKRVARIIRRHVLQTLGIEKASYKPSFKLLKNMFGWNADYQNYERASILTMLEPYQSKVMIVTSDKEIKHLLQNELQ